MDPTPLQPAPWAASLLLKREDVHELGAFKRRGALATLERWRSDVVTASTGNHGAATAWAATRLGLEATVFVPKSSSSAKLRILDELGARLVQVGADLDEAKDAARLCERARPAALRGRRRAGAARRLRRDRQRDPRPARGSARGWRRARRQRRAPRRNRPNARRARAGDAANRRRRQEGARDGGELGASRPVESDRCTTIADGLAVRVAIPFAVESLQEYADEMLLVSERELAQAVRDYHVNGIRAEPAAAAALAAIPQLAIEGAVVLIATGRNIDEELLERCLDDPDSFPD